MTAAFWAFFAFYRAAKKYREGRNGRLSTVSDNLRPSSHGLRLAVFRILAPRIPPAGLISLFSHVLDTAPRAVELEGAGGKGDSVGDGKLHLGLR